MFIITHALAPVLFADAISGGIGWLQPWKIEVIGSRLIPPDDWFAWDGWMIASTAFLGLVLAYRRRVHLAKDDGPGSDAEREE